MSITIHPELETKLRARAEAGGVTVEEYVERLIRADQQADNELEALALEGSTPASRLSLVPAIGQTNTGALTKD
jgi:hypothetical protein